MEDIVDRVEKIKNELEDCWTMDSRYCILRKKLKDEEEPLRKETQKYIQNYLDSMLKGIYITKSGYFDREGDLLRGLEHRIDQEEIQTPHLSFLRDYILDEEVVFSAVVEHNMGITA